MRALQPALQSPGSEALGVELEKRRRAGAIIYPGKEYWFHALEMCPLEAVRVVILGQDPYHGPGQAHGLAFSVRPGVKAPPSLKNIFKEACREYGGDPGTQDPFLERWSSQGVLLLNTVLTVEDGQPGCHRGMGWEEITDAALDAVVAKSPASVFLLWGNDAREKKSRITGDHLVLEAAHPSPLSASRGFLGCGHFKRANQWLAEKGLPEIRWVQ